MKKSIILFLSFLALATSTLATESKIVTVEGGVRSFDKEIVQINTPKGVRSIPRKFIPATINLKSGESIKIPLNEEQLKEVK